MQTPLPAEPQGKKRELLFTHKHLLAVTIATTTLAIPVIVILSTIGIIPTFLAVIISTVAGLSGTVSTLRSQTFSTNTTESTFARNLCEMLNEPGPNFGNLSPQNQAPTLFNVLEMVNR